MRLRWRKGVITPPQDEAAKQKEAQADRAVREAQLALQQAKGQNKAGSLIAETLAAIREENHFREMWNKGIGS